MPGFFDSAKSFLGSVEDTAENASETVQNVAGDLQDVIAETQDVGQGTGGRRVPPRALRDDDSGKDAEANEGLVDRIGGLPMVGAAVLLVVILFNQ